MAAFLPASRHPHSILREWLGLGQPGSLVMSLMDTSYEGSVLRNPCDLKNAKAKAE